MLVQLIIANGKCQCRNPQCTKNPEYIITNKNWPTRPGRIKKGTTCASIRLDSANGWNTSYYCRDCLVALHDEVRKVLNPKLWLFT